MLSKNGVKNTTVIKKVSKQTMKTLFLTILILSLPYSRSDWKAWIDADKDCQDTREEVLIRDSISITFDSERKCNIIEGIWEDAYTGDLLIDKSLIDIDHIVPLKEAHDSGGAEWTLKEKEAFANDLDNPWNLQITHQSWNRSKKDKRPDEWRPPNKEKWCNYAIGWLSVKLKWKLSMIESEKAALAEMLQTCGVF